MSPASLSDTAPDGAAVKLAASALCSSPSAAPVSGRVSVIIPAFNCAETIAAAVESCLVQTFADTEVIVVDDGSTDRTAEVLERFGTRIRVIHQPNGGLACARNAGARAATGEFVAWMDGDDLALPDRLAIQAGVLAARPDIALVSSDFSTFTDAGPDIASSHIATYYHAVNRLGGVARIYPFEVAIDAFVAAGGEAPAVRCGPAYEWLLWGNFVHPPTVMLRRCVFDTVGYFDESLRYNSDYDLIVRAARTGPFAYVDRSLLRYRLSSTQMSHAAAGGRIALETTAILGKIQRADPAFYAAHRAVFRARIGQSLILAAEGVAAHDRRKAFTLLLNGLRGYPTCPHGPRVLARILAPAWIVAAVRRIKRVVRPGNPPTH